MGDVPRAPAGLGGPGRSLWRSLVASFELNEYEVRVLELAARQFDDIDRLEKLLAKDGLVVEGSQGQPRLSSVVSELRQARLAAAKLLDQLGIPGEDDRVVTSSARRAKRAADARWSRVASLRERRAGGPAAG